MATHYLLVKATRMITVICVFVFDFVKLRANNIYGKLISHIESHKVGMS